MKIEWNEEYFFNLIKFAYEENIYSKLNKNKEELILESNKKYIIYKDMFGVKIENGELFFTKIIISDVLQILNNLLKLEKKGKNFKITPIQNLDFVKKIIDTYNLEKINEKMVEGYLINNEFVNYCINENVSEIRIKYRNNEFGIFYIYKIYILNMDKELYLCVEKSF